jgi:predicted RNase H-like nuclease (RuvC/YqgF family)
VQKGGLIMDEQIYSVPVLHNEIQNLKQRVNDLEEEVKDLEAEVKEDRKVFTQSIKTISENLVRQTTISEQQAKQLEDMSANIDMLREEITRNNENNVKWYQDKYDLVMKILIALVLIGWSLKGVSEAIKLINP